MPAAFCASAPRGMKRTKVGGRWLCPMALLALSMTLFTGALIANFAVKQHWFDECVSVGAVHEGDGATHVGSTGLITDRSGIPVVERTVHLPGVAALLREATVVLGLSLCSLGAAVVVAVPRRPHTTGLVRDCRAHGLLGPMLHAVTRGRAVGADAHDD